MSRILNQEAARHQIAVEDGALIVTAQEAEWLFAAVTAVANASANAARIAIDSLSGPGEEALVNRIGRALDTSFPERMVKKDYFFRGRSGKDHHFDFALRGGEARTILINAVATHHFSISSRYVSFADTRIEGYEDVGRFAVFDRPLEEGDASLLSQVADLVPLKALIAGAQQRMLRQAWPQLPPMTFKPI